MPEYIPPLDFYEIPDSEKHRITVPDDSDIIIDHAEGYIEIKNHTRKKRFYLKLEEVPYE